MRDIFSKSNELLKEVIYTKIKKYPTFLQLKSVFPSKWFNLIVPSVSENIFSWKDSEKLINSEKEEGVGISYYIREKKIDSYKDELVKRGYSEFATDVYMFLSMKGKFEVKGDYSEVKRDSLNKYLSLNEECFPDWEYNRRYGEYFYKLKLKGVKDKFLSNAMFKLDDDFVAFGSVVASKKMNLAYLHNAGTVRKHRKKGYHNNLVKYRCNLAFNNGVREIYSIVEEGKGSYISLSKLGFKPAVTYFLFAQD